MDALRASPPAGHAVGRAEDPRDADHRRARAGQARALRRRGRLPLLHGRPRHLHLHPLGAGQGRRACTCRPAAGIVADSEPDYEVRETEAKAGAVFGRDRAGLRAGGLGVTRRAGRSTTTTRSPTTSSSTWASSAPSSRWCATTRQADELLERAPDRVIVSPGPVHARARRASRCEAIRALRRGRRAGARRLPRPPGARRRVRRAAWSAASRCTARPRRSSTTAGRSSPGSNRRSWPAATTRWSSTPRPAGQLERSARRGRRDHGPPPPRAARRGRAVPPRVGAHRRTARRCCATSSASCTMPNPSSPRRSTGSPAARTSPRDEAAAVLARDHGGQRLGGADRRPS